MGRRHDRPGPDHRHARPRHGGHRHRVLVHQPRACRDDRHRGVRPRRRRPCRRTRREYRLDVHGRRPGVVLRARARHHVLTCRSTRRGWCRGRRHDDVRSGCIVWDRVGAVPGARRFRSARSGRGHHRDTRARGVGTGRRPARRSTRRRPDDQLHSHHDRQHTAHDGDTGHDHHDTTTTTSTTTTPTTTSTTPAATSTTTVFQPPPGGTLPRTGGGPGAGRIADIGSWLFLLGAGLFACGRAPRNSRGA